MTGFIDFEADADDGDEIILLSSRGWMRDRDGWWRRPIGPRDRRIIQHDRAVRRIDTLDSAVDAVLAGQLVWWIGDSCNAWIANGELICRNAKQKRRLDNGLSV